MSRLLANAVTLPKPHIYDQERLIERLADEGQSNDDAFVLLNLLTQSLRQFERHRLLVLEQLGKGK